ncbi:hypothetical protein J437_LFUL000509 [Ladona fulva]|uniref:Uncharacterized protein n=1 Tax=Ladona fulva TaxID=123851 RepID=A0A8K0NRJ6_LADFU|nr:hypothetical protein J437_LFUL000509 [Ladona fulva]
MKMEEKIMRSPRSSTISTRSSINFNKSLLMRFRTQRTSGTGSIFSLQRGLIGIGVRVISSPTNK